MTPPPTAAATRTLRHAMALALVLLLAGVTAACGSDDDSTATPVAADTDGETTGDESDADRDGDGADDPMVPADDEFPPPDPETFEGRNRVVNLWIDDEGNTSEIDVWAFRSFTAGPVLLAEGLGFGDVSEYFAAPSGQSIVFTAAGTGPDAEELGSMFRAEANQQITAVYTWSPDRFSDQETSVPNYWEFDDLDPTMSPEGPAAGKGLVIIRSPQVWAFEDQLEASLGSKSWRVGAGDGECLYQRVEDEGFSPAILGGTAEILHEADPGTVAFTLHTWPDIDECATDPVFESEVDVAADASVLVIVYTTDGESLDTMVLPFADPGD
jgi:hypothetical protein